MTYNRRDRKYRLIRDDVQAAPDEFVIYSVLNTDIIMARGIAASMVRIKKLLRYFNLLQY